MTTNLYPIIDEEMRKREEENRMADFNENLKLQCNDKMSKMRCDIIKTKYKDLEALHKHYEKLSKRWNKVSNVLRITGISIASLFGIAGITVGALVSAGTIIPVIIPVILSGSTIVDEALCECLLRTYAKKRKQYFNSKRELIQKYLNRLYHLLQKIIDDGKITIEEMKTFYDLIDAFENEMKISKDNNQNDDINLKQLNLEKIKKEAEIEAQIEAKKELKERYKNEKKTNLLQSVA